MKRLFHIWIRLKRLKWHDIFCLTILSITACLLALTLSCLDMSTTSLLLQDQGLLGIGINYLFAAVIWIIIAYFARKIDRQKGYGAAAMGFIMSVIWLGLASAYRFMPKPFVYQALFVAKYSSIFLFNVSFWALAVRFVKASMGSLKYLGIFSFELLGLFLGGLLGQTLSSETLFYGATIGLVICCCFFKGLGLLSPLSREVFIKKVGGVQDLSQKIIMDTILALSFCWTCTRLLVEFQVYHYIVENELQPIEILGKLNMAISGICLLGLLGLVRTRFLYTTPLGLIVCALAVGCCALGGIFDESWLFFSGVILFFVTSHFYIHRYLSLLPRPFAQGQGFPLKKIRWLVMVPCAFILVGALLLTVPLETINWILLAAMFLLSILFTLSGYLYGRELVTMCSLRIWRDGPFMISYPPLRQMILQGLSKNNSEEAFYFLNFLNEGYASEYRSILTQMLHHPSESIRLFVLEKLRKFGLSTQEHSLLLKMMANDPSVQVQNMALSVLISETLEINESTAWHKYQNHLQEPSWILGACSGFLFGHGVWRDKAIQKVLKLAQSPKEKDQLCALSLMAGHPQKEWISSIDQLLNSPSSSVVKSALNVAGKLASPSLLNRLLPLLDEPQWRDDVLETLNQYGKLAFPTIEKMILSDSIPMERQKELILFLGRLPSGEGKQLLLRVLFTANRLLKASVIESLTDASIVWVHKDRQRILKKAIFNTAMEWIAIRDTLINAENIEHEKLQNVKELFQKAIKEELDRTRYLLLDLLELYNLQPLAHNALETLKSTDWNAFAGAASCLQDILPKNIYNKVHSILLYPTWNEPPKALEHIALSTFLNIFVLNPPEWISPWLKALALYGWQQLGDPAGLIAVKEGLKSKDWIVLEAALSALWKLKKNKAQAEELILNIPTRYLLKQNLENILEDNHAYHH